MCGKPGAATRTKNGDASPVELTEASEEAEASEAPSSEPAPVLASEAPSGDETSEMRRAVTVSCDDVVFVTVHVCDVGCWMSEDNEQQAGRARE